MFQDPGFYSVGLIAEFVIRYLFRRTINEMFNFDFKFEHWILLKYFFFKFR